MRVLTLSDEVVPVVYSLQIKERFADVDLVLACGDLPYYYLEYCVSMLNIPCLYVAGNHDKDEWTGGGELITHPRGCTSVEDRIMMTHGLTVAGLGGSLRYNNESGAQNYSYGVAAETYYNQTMILNTAGYRHMTIERSTPTGRTHV